MPSVTEEASNLQRKEETDREKGIRLHSRIKHFLEKVQERPAHEILDQYRGTTPEFDQFLSFYQTFCIGKKWKVARVGNQLAVEYSVVGRTGEGERLLQGRIDAIFMDPSNKCILVDWKRSCTREGKYFSRSKHQLNLYESILRDEPYHCTIAKKMIVNLHPNLTEYEIIPVPIETGGAACSAGPGRTNEQRLVDIIEKMVGIQEKYVESTFGDNRPRGNESFAQRSRCTIL